MARFQYDAATGLMVPAERGRIVHRAPRLLSGSAQQALSAYGSSGPATDPSFSSVDLLIIFFYYLAFIFLKKKEYKDFISNNNIPKL